MTIRRLILIAVPLATAAAVAVVIANRTGASERGALSRLSNVGRNIDLRHEALVRKLGVQHASLLAARRARAVYLLATSRGTCIGTGPATNVGEIQAVDCPDGPFPTAERPVLDLSVYESTTRGRREVSLYRAEGVTADGVATVAFFRPNGKVALRVPVSGNVFTTSAVPPGPIAGIAAFDSADKELWRSPGG
jgi:hypothetical protein